MTECIICIEVRANFLSRCIKPKVKKSDQKDCQIKYPLTPHCHHFSHHSGEALAFKTLPSPPHAHVPLLSPFLPAPFTTLQPPPILPLCQTSHGHHFTIHSLPTLGPLFYNSHAFNTRLYPRYSPLCCTSLISPLLLHQSAPHCMISALMPSSHHSPL